MENLRLLTMPFYLDYNATAPVRPEVVSRMAEVLALPLNPSSVHGYGREAKRILEESRRTLAEAVSALPQEVVFCASGTEANNWALRGFPQRRVLVSAVEHSSILKALPPQGGGMIPVDANGIISLDTLEEMLANGTLALVSLMLANNETGVIQPVAEAAALCRKYGALLHCDAVQGFGKIPVDCGLLGADVLTLSGHKCGAPPGAAALVVRSGVVIPPMLSGGGQERGLRASTENVAAIAGWARAVELCDFGHMRQLRGWLDAMEEETAAVVIGGGAARLPNTSCIALPGVSSEVQLIKLDLQGIMVSAGSACSSGRVEPSHVLRAMGVPDALSGCAIRISGGWGTQKAEIQRFAEAWQGLRQSAL